MKNKPIIKENENDEYQSFEKNISTSINDLELPSKSQKKELYLEFNDAIEKCGFGLSQIFIFVICGFMWSVCAMGTLFFSFFLPIIKKNLKMAPIINTLLGCLFFFGQFCGANVWGYIADKFGRKIALFWYSLILSLSLIFFSVSPPGILLNFSIWLFGFSISGCHVPFGFMTEFLPQSKRAIIMVSFEYFWVIGEIFEVVVCWIVLPYHKIHIFGPSFSFDAWRLAAFLTSIPVMACIAFVIFLIPESPRYLICEGKYKEANKILNMVAFWNFKRGFKIFIKKGKKKKSKPEIEIEIEKNEILNYGSNHDSEIENESENIKNENTENEEESDDNSSNEKSSNDSSEDGEDNSLNDETKKILKSKETINEVTEDEEDENGDNINNNSTDEEENDEDNDDDIKETNLDIKSTKSNTLLKKVLKKKIVHKNNDDDDDTDEEEDDESEIEKKTEKKLIFLKNQENKKLIEPKKKKKKKNTTSFIYLFSRKLFLTTVFLSLVWFFVAFCYYGVLLMTPKFFEFHSTSKVKNPTGFTVFLNTLITSAAEIPGLIMCSILSIFFGRKLTIAISFGVCAISMFILVIPLPGFLLTTFSVFARAGIMSAFASCYLYTPEVFPTGVRGKGLGFVDCISRASGILSPIVGSYILEFSEPLTLMICVGSCIIGGIFAILLPIETKGKQMKEFLDDEEETEKKTSK